MYIHTHIYIYNYIIIRFSCHRVAVDRFTNQVTTDGGLPLGPIGSGRLPILFRLNSWEFEAFLPTSTGGS